MILEMRAFEEDFYRLVQALLRNYRSEGSYCLGIIRVRESGFVAQRWVAKVYVLIHNVSSHAVKWRGNPSRHTMDCLKRQINDIKTACSVDSDSTELA